MSDDMEINYDEIVEAFTKKGAINKQLCSTKNELVPVFFDAIQEYHLEKNKLMSTKYINEQLHTELSEQTKMNYDICCESLELDEELEKLQKLQTDGELEMSNLITNFANVSDVLNRQIKKIDSEYDNENLNNNIKLLLQQHEEGKEKMMQLQSVLDSEKEFLKRIESETTVNNHLRNIAISLEGEVTINFDYVQ